MVATRLTLGTIIADLLTLLTVTQNFNLYLMVFGRDDVWVDVSKIRR